MSELCVICGLHLYSDIVTVKKRGIERLVSVSQERNDGKEKLFHERLEIRLHRKCRLTYVESKTIQAYKRRREAEASKISQSSSIGETFDFKNLCFLCNEEAGEEFQKLQIKRPVSSRIVVSQLSKCTTQKTILNAAEKHKDNWSEQVLRRIKDVDLLEQKAVYHGHCYTKFCHPYRAAGLSRGKCQSPENAHAMNLIYNYLETNSDDYQFSLQDIRNALPEIEPLSDPVIKYNLRKKYGSELIITPGKPSIICLLKNCTHIIQNSWYEARQSKDVDEKKRIVEAAGKIVLEEIASRIYETDSYPAPTDLLKDQEKYCPPLLLRLLKIIIMHNKNKKESYEAKCVALAHGIMSAARPRTFRSPLLLGLSSLIHHKYASRYLIDIFSEIGFCATYDETLKFKLKNDVNCTDKICDSDDDVVNENDFDTVTEVEISNILQSDASDSET